MESSQKYLNVEDEIRALRLKNRLTAMAVFGTIAAWVIWMFWYTGTGGDVGAVMDSVTGWILALLALLFVIKFIVRPILFFIRGR